jgi:preprotein translocase subunit SecA
MVGFIKNWLDSNARDIAKYMAVTKKIDALEPELKKLSNEELRERSDKLRQRVQKEYAARLEAAPINRDALTDAQIREEDRKIYTPILDSVLVEAFALVREASVRTIGLRHYPVQHVGGMVLHDGRIAEMRTGEGKTLVATCPMYLNALLGKGAHLVTANDYLSKRDAVWNGPIYHMLGMSVGIIQGQSPETGSEGGSYIYDPEYEDADVRFRYARPCSRKEAYACDITYGTNNEYGFDYLRDNMALSEDELTQRELHFAIVDEVDSILIDEARTPLIISGMVEHSTQNYAIVDAVVAKMKRGIDDPKKDKDNPDADKHKPDIHYVVDEKAKTATITDAGVDYVEKALGIDNISENQEIMHYLSAAMKAHGVFRKDIDYVVKDVDPNDDEGPEIIIVDENTGRLMFGRRYSDGLHQAIEAKEHVEVKNESQTLATVTFQNYFRLYSKLGGMTGTAKTEEDEFRKIYALDVVTVPTNREVKRIDHPDLVFKSEEHKLRNIAAEILRIYCKQQPVLVGTRSIEMSERVSARVGPQSLSTLCLIQLARTKMENTKGFDASRARDITAVLNERMEPSVTTDERGNRVMRPALTLSRIKPILKELGIDPDPLTPANMNEIARIFEVAEADYERLEEALTHGIEHRILNAKFHEKEAIIIAEAGRKGAVTIATNMAGRGVDILLGGKHIDQELPPVDGSLKSLSEAEKAMEAGDPDDDVTIVDEQNYMRYGKPRVLEAVTTGALTDEEHKAAAEEVRKLGGLFILGTERHESRRIDNQLRGRAGRQGDPGESLFMVSLEDELWRLFGDRTSHPFLKTWEDHIGMDSKILSPMIQRAQRKVEEFYFESRKNVLNYDDVMNRQRELIYKERRKILKGVDLKNTIISYIKTNIAAAVDTFAPADAAPADYRTDELFADLDQNFSLAPVLSVDDIEGKSRQELVSFLTDHVLNVYASKEQEIDAIQGEGTMRELERWMALRAVNSKWMEHLANMDHLREGIGWRGMEQKDPLLIYQKEAFDEFERMQQAIQDDIVRNVLHLQFQVEQAPPPQALMQPMNAAPAIPLPKDLPKFPSSDTPRNITTNMGGASSQNNDGAPPDWKGGRNDLCWCGSGQKYKRCHGSK